jgi:hypothetical protein
VYYCCDIQDGLFTFNVYKHHEKPWVAQLVIPYLVLFGIACIVSLFTLVQKSKLLIGKFRQRHAAQQDAAENPSQQPPAVMMQEKLEEIKMEIRSIQCVLLLGATEGAHRDFRVMRYAPECLCTSGSVQTCRCPYSRSTT